MPGKSINLNRLSKTIDLVVFLLTGFICLVLLKGDAVSQEAQTFTNSIGMEFVRIPSGKFIMGEAPRTECDTCNASADETPRHYVSLTKSFYMGRYEVTQEQWLAVMEENPSQFRGDKRPVESISWDNVQLFIYALNIREKTTSYRLPTEAEWEYAARAGTSEAYSFGDDFSLLKHYGCFIQNSGAKTKAVGELKPNPWGLYDMHGNVFEWCQDRYSRTYYLESPSADPAGPPEGDLRVRRGGCWGSSVLRCRSSARDFMVQDNPSGNTGFRLVKDLY